MAQWGAEGQGRLKGGVGRGGVGETHTGKAKQTERRKEDGSAGRQLDGDGREEGRRGEKANKTRAVKDRGSRNQRRNDEREGGKYSRRKMEHPGADGAGCA